MSRSLFLYLEFIKQHLVEQDFPNLAINLPNLFIQRRHHTLVFVKDFVRQIAQLIKQFLAVQLIQGLTAMLLKETPQDVMKQFAGIDCLEIESGLSARFEFQNTLAKKTISAVSIDAQSAGAVNKLRTKSLL